MDNFNCIIIHTCDLHKNHFDLDLPVDYAMDFFVKNKFIETSKTNINDDNFMDKVIEYINFPKYNFPRIVGQTKILYENYDTSYQMCFLDIEPKDAEKYNILRNDIATMLLPELRLIYGDAIIIKVKLPIDSNNMYNSIIEFKDLAILLLQKRRHYGVKISQTGDLSEFCFNNKMHFVNQDGSYLTGSIKKNKTLVKFLYGYNLIVYYDDNNKEVNTVATNFVNKKAFTYKNETENTIYGDCVILLQVNSQAYGDFRLNEYNKIFETNDPLTQEDLQEEKDEYTRTIIKTRFRLLEKKNKYVLKN